MGRKKKVVLSQEQEQGNISIEPVEKVTSAPVEKVKSNVKTQEDEVLALKKKIAELEKLANIKKKPEILVLTTNMDISCRLQNVGIEVYAVTGGGNLKDKKKHYLITTIDKIKKLINKKERKPLIEDFEYEEMSEVKDIEPTKFTDTGLENAVKSKGPEDLRKAKARLALG